MSDGSQNPLLVVPGSPYPSMSAQHPHLVNRVRKQRRQSRLFSKIPSISPTAYRTTFPLPASPLVTETPVRGTFSKPSRTAAGKQRATDPPADDSDDDYEDVVDQDEPDAGDHDPPAPDNGDGSGSRGEGPSGPPGGDDAPGNPPEPSPRPSRRPSPNPPGGGDDPPGDDGPTGGGGGPRRGPRRARSPSTNDDGNMAKMVIDGINGLTKVIAGLANPQPARSSRSNLRNPDTFDGSDPMKLRPFLAQCYLHFAEREHDFQTDDDKIIYMMSFFRGTALDWFEPQMFDPDPNTVPAWDNNFPVFLQELQDTFGPDDPVGEAEDQLRNLRMQHSDHLSTYLVSFNRLAAYTGWGMAALRYQFYEGLPRRIKDNLVHIDYPNTLVGVRNAAHRVDSRYWKREGEKKREASGRPDKGSDPTSNKSSSGNGNGSSGKSAKSSGKRNKSNSSSNTPNAAASTSKTDSAPKANPKPYADKLDKNGQIKADERARRVKLNLCMYCGGSGHKASECKKRPTTAQGKAATTEPTTATIKEIDSSAESKK
jgi:hypothetical protein